jgi:hypothetical protein
MKLCADTLVGCYCEGNALKIVQPIDWQAWQRVADYVNAQLARYAVEARLEEAREIRRNVQAHHDDAIGQYFEKRIAALEAELKEMMSQ